MPLLTIVLMKDTCPCLGHTGVWGVIFAITGGPSHVQNSAVR